MSNDDTPTDDTPTTCLICGKESVVRVVYGYPSPGMFAAADAGRIVLGGCVITGPDTMPRWACTNCG